MRKIKYLVMLPILLFLLVVTTSCYSLGSFHDEAEYQATFDISIKNGNTDTSYDFSSFNNKSVIEDLDCPISCGNYSYIAIKAKSDVKIKAIAFYVKGESSDKKTISLNIYKHDMPTKLRDLSSELAELEKAKEESRTPSITYDFDEPLAKNAYLSTTFAISNAKWSDVYKDKLSISLSAGDCVLIQITNNSDANVKQTTDIDELTKLIETQNESRISFQITGILMASE